MNTLLCNGRLKIIENSLNETKDIIGDVFECGVYKGVIK